jgi:hypothetical protein
VRCESGQVTCTASCGRAFCTCCITLLPPLLPFFPPPLPPSSKAKLAPRVFQDKWKSLPQVGQAVHKALTPATVTAMAANQHKDICAHFTQAYIQTTASGGAPPTYK